MTGMTRGNKNMSRSAMHCESSDMQTINHDSKIGRVTEVMVIRGTA